MLGIKQEALAYELGDEWTQKKVSLMEQKEEIENDLLERVAKVLKVPSEAIKNLDEETAINIISNTFQDSSILNAGSHPTFNPIDKVVQLYDEKVSLYERMLKDKNEMIAQLQKIIAEKK